MWCEIGKIFYPVEKNNEWLSPDYSIIGTVNGNENFG